MHILTRLYLLLLQTTSSFGVGPVLLGFFVFVLVGSSVIQILRTAQMGL